MELTFNKTGELYVAEFKADKEFSLHIERMNGLGSIKMQQNGAEGGKYADVEDFEASNSTKPVIEYDSGAFVAPKWIRIESSVLPTYAAITTEGDVVEIKSQVKSIEVTANGNTEVIPDAGFAGLTKVNVSVNVPQSGGSGEDGGNTMEYFDLSNEQTAIYPILNSVALFCTKLKLATSDGEPTAIMDYSGLSVMSMQMANYKIIGGGVDFNTITITKQNGEIIKSTYLESFLQTIAQGGYTIEDYNNLPRITKEQFYNLES